MRQAIAKARGEFWPAAADELVVACSPSRLTSVVTNDTMRRCGVVDFRTKTRGNIVRRVLVVLGITLVAVAVSATAAQAARLANARAVLPFAIFNPCTGEDVVGEIRVHFLLTLTTNGNNVSGMELLQYSAQGVGQTTGARYAGNESGHAPFKASLSNGQATMTDSVTFHLTTPGGGNNVVISGRSHTTVNANGDVSVSYDDLTTACV